MCFIFLRFLLFDEQPGTNNDFCKVFILMMLTLNAQNFIELILVVPKIINVYFSERKFLINNKTISTHSTKHRSDFRSLSLNMSAFCLSNIFNDHDNSIFSPKDYVTILLREQVLLNQKHAINKHRLFIFLHLIEQRLLFNHP